MYIGIISDYLFCLKRSVIFVSSILIDNSKICKCHVRTRFQAWYPCSMAFKSVVWGKYLICIWHVKFLPSKLRMIPITPLSDMVWIDVWQFAPKQLQVAFFLTSLCNILDVIMDLMQAFQFCFPFFASISLNLVMKKMWLFNFVFFS
mgnify:CR=1 FL=1